MEYPQSRETKRRKGGSGASQVHLDMGRGLLAAVLTWGPRGLELRGGRFEQGGVVGGGVRRCEARGEENVDGSDRATPGHAQRPWPSTYEHPQSAATSLHVASANAIPISRG